MFDLVLIGVGMILAGFMVIFLAAAMSGGSSSSDQGEERTKARGGGVIIIGPIPIVFGSDSKWASIAMVLAIVLVVLVLLSWVLIGR